MGLEAKMATLHYPNRVLGNVVESDSAQKQAATAPANRKLRLPTHHSLFYLRERSDAERVATQWWK